MIDLKPTIEAALKSNTQLVTLLGGKRVYKTKAINPEEFPRITFFEMDNTPGLNADDEEIASAVYVQVDIWSKADNTSAIAFEVNKTMKAIGFGRTASASLFEEDTQIYHKAMRFSALVETEQ